MKFFEGKRLWTVAIVLVAVSVMAFSVLRGCGHKNAKSIEPPVEKDRVAARMVRDMDLIQRAKQPETVVWAEGAAGSVRPVTAVPKIVKPAALPVKISPTKTPTSQASPVKVTRVKTY